MRKSLAAAIVAMSFLGACTSDSATGGDPVSPVAQRDDLIQAGINAYVAGDTARAEAIFQQVFDADPNDPFANLNLGVIKAQTNRTPEAVAHYQTAVANGQNVYVDDIWTKTGSFEAQNITIAQVAAGNLKRLTN